MGLEQGTEEEKDVNEAAPRFRSALVRLENPMTWKESDSNHLGRADSSDRVRQSNGESQKFEALKFDM